MLSVGYTLWSSVWAPVTYRQALSWVRLERTFVKVLAKTISNVQGILYVEWCQVVEIYPVKFNQKPWWVENCSRGSTWNIKESLVASRCLLRAINSSLPKFPKVSKSAGVKWSRKRKNRKSPRQPSYSGQVSNNETNGLGKCIVNLS